MEEVSPKCEEPLAIVDCADIVTRLGLEPEAASGAKNWLLVGDTTVEPAGSYPALEDLRVEVIGPE